MLQTEVELQHTELALHGSKSGVHATAVSVVESVDASVPVAASEPGTSGPHADTPHPDASDNKSTALRTRESCQPPLSSSRTIRARNQFVGMTTVLSCEMFAPAG